MSKTTQETLKKQILSTTHRVYSPLSELYTLGEIQERVNQLVAEHGKSGQYSFIVSESGEITEEVCVFHEETDEQQRTRIESEIANIVSEEKRLSTALAALQKGLKKL